MRESSADKVQILADDLKRLSDSFQLADVIDHYIATNPPTNILEALRNFALGIGGAAYVAGSGVVMIENYSRLANNRPLLRSSH